MSNFCKGKNVTNLDQNSEWCRDKIQVTYQPSLPLPVSRKLLATSSSYTSLPLVFFSFTSVYIHLVMRFNYFQLKGAHTSFCIICRIDDGELVIISLHSTCASENGLIEDTSCLVMSFWATDSNAKLAKTKQASLRNTIGALCYKLPISSIFGMNYLFWYG